MNSKAGVKRDMKDPVSQVEMVENRNEQRRRIHVDDH